MGSIVNTVGPMLIGPELASRVLIFPPGYSERSNTFTSKPSWANFKADTSPPIPAPTTAIFLRFRIMGTSLAIMNC